MISLMNRKCWKLNLLSEMFDTKEAASISRIPVSKLGSPVVLVWHHDNKGVYTVRSGHKLLCRSEAVEGNTHGEVNNETWKQFWSLNLPSKIKVFLWRILNEILPVKATLLIHKMVLLDNTCFRCFQAAETSYHALINVQ